MKNYKAYAISSIVVALILSHIMCIHIAYTYCDMLWGVEYAGYSAPAGVAFVLLIPYMVGVMIALLAALLLLKKANRVVV